MPSSSVPLRFLGLQHLFHLDFSLPSPDSIRVGAFRDLFHPELLVEDMEDSGGNFARGKITLGRKIINLIVKKLRVITESCDSVQGFVVMNSYGGGTGSGIGSLVAEKLSHEFAKQTRINLGVFPGKVLGVACTEPYNSLLFSDSVIRDFDMSVLVENDRLYHICQDGIGMDRPNFFNCNRIVAQVISSITSNLRFDGDLCGTMEDLRVNLVPYPNLCFPVSAYAPIFDTDRANHSTNETDDYIKQCFYATNRMVDCPMESNRQLSTCMFFRGDFSAHEVNKSLARLKKSKAVNFVDWCPTGFKLSFVGQPSNHLPKSMLGNLGRSTLLLANTSAMQTCFKRLKNNVKFMLAKRAYFHWYEQEGMELDDFRRAYEEINIIQYDYWESGRSIESVDRMEIADNACDYTKRLFDRAASAHVNKLAISNHKSYKTSESATYRQRLQVNLGLFGMHYGSEGLPYTEESLEQTNQCHAAAEPEVENVENRNCSSSCSKTSRNLKSTLCKKCTREVKIFKLRSKGKGDGMCSISDIKKIICQKCRAKLS